MAIYLGIDGGGSKTSCLIGDETSVLGTGTGAASNVVRVGEAQARESLAGAIRQACTVAHLNPSEIGNVCVGLAGAARPEISELVRRIVSELVPGKVEVVGDNVIALQAAFGDGPGVIVIAGTGSIAYGRNREGQTARAGGWGFAISDEGSGHWIGRTAVAAAIGAWDERPRTGPAPDRDADEVLAPANHRAAGAGRERHAAAGFCGAFSRRTFAGRLRRPHRARRSDPSRNSTREPGGILLRRLFPNAGAVPVAMSGGVFGSSALVRQIFYNSLRSGHPDAVINPNVIEPVRGALELARKGAAK